MQKIKEKAGIIRISDDLDDFSQDPSKYRHLEKSKEELKKFNKEGRLKDLNLQFEEQDEEDEDDIGEINDQFKNANIEDEEDEDIDNPGESAKATEIEYSELKKTINQYLDQSINLLERK